MLTVRRREPCETIGDNKLGVAVRKAIELVIQDRPAVNLTRPRAQPIQDLAMPFADEGRSLVEERSHAEHS